MEIDGADGIAILLVALAVAVAKAIFGVTLPSRPWPTGPQVRTFLSEQVVGPRSSQSKQQT